MLWGGGALHFRQGAVQLHAPRIDRTAHLALTILQARAQGLHMTPCAPLACVRSRPHGRARTNLFVLKCVELGLSLSAAPCCPFIIHDLLQRTCLLWARREQALHYSTLCPHGRPHRHMLAQHCPRTARHVLWWLHARNVRQWSACMGPRGCPSLTTGG